MLPSNDPSSRVPSARVRGFARAAGVAPTLVLALCALTFGVLAVPSLLVAQQPPPPPGAYDGSPYLGQIRNTYLYGNLWERPQLSPRDRSLVTMAVNQSLYATDELRIHINRGLDNGVTQEEIAELVAHVLWYAGFPTGVNASRVAAEVFEERGLPIPSPSSPRTPPSDPEPEFPGALQATPYLTALLNDVLYAETWERSELSPRDRSLITIAANTALYRTDELNSHIRRGLDNGLTQEQISEIIHHVTWYAGFPAGVNASRVAEEIFEARGLPLPDSDFPGAPWLDELVDDLVYGETWERPELSPRERSLATIAATQSAYQTDQLRFHMGLGLDNGLTADDLSELVAHVTLYSGFPTGVNASELLAEIFRERGIPLPDPERVNAPDQRAGGNQIYELRTYTTHPGRLDALLARFRDHTRPLFEKHGMENVGYWVPQDEPLSENTLVYVLAHPSREAGEAAWEAFLSDPEWLEVREASVADGPILEGVERIWLDPTDFSGMR
ncbi:MAG: carboxymuconolactone decarboxylase family protein [Longimicrobiales bacterium]